MIWVDLGLKLIWGRTKLDERLSRIQDENRAIFWAYNDVFEVEKGGLKWYCGP